MLEIKEDMIISFMYTNWKGETAKRKCVVIGFVYGSNEYHKEDQLLLKGFDLDKDDARTYSVKDMSEIEAA